MNQTYIDAIKTAHKLCKEMSEMDNKTDEFHSKTNEYCLFALEASEYDWHIGAYILKIALVEYKLGFNAELNPAFKTYDDKYREQIMGSGSDEVAKNSYLTDDLLYLRDIKSDQT